MVQLNDTNGASKITKAMAARVLNEFEGDQLWGAEFGVAYGGGVETIGKLWGTRGVVFGFDTFEGHPIQVGDQCEYTKKVGGSKSSFAAGCMDEWYRPESYGMDKLKLEYIQGELHRQNINNVVLIKGLVHAQTNIDFIPRLHYCLLDLDFPISMWHAYNLIKNKMVKGGYLCLHDVIPKGHIPGCWEYYQKMMGEGLFELVEEHAAGTHLVTLRKL